MKKLSTPKILVISFLTVILAGTMLLMLPVSSADHTVTPLLDALFTAVTATCVTGLTTVTTAMHWSAFGQGIILMMIQIGGLGAAALPMVIFLVLGRRLSLKYSKILGDSFNLDNIGQIRSFLKRVVLGILFVEMLGAAAYMPVFISEHGIGKGIWFSVFHSISAFCNAGIDIIGPDSLIPYVTHPWVNMVTIALIVLGGIGFLVWWDLLSVFRKKKKELSLHSKIVLTATGFLIVFGAVIFFIFESHNPETMGDFSLPEKILASLFQSVTTRTAGFASIPQSGLTDASVIVSAILMFIGGSSVGTAGGVKTGTVAVIILSVVSTVRGQKDTLAFGRRISDEIVKKAMAVVSLSAAVSLTVICLLLAVENAGAKDIVFEVYSALGTAGLSRGLTPLLGTFGKCVIIVCMFFGRIGPISIASALTVRDTNHSTRYIQEDITVG